MAWPEILDRCRRVSQLFNGQPARVQINPPARRAQIRGAETVAGLLPSAYRELLEISNGLRLFPWAEGWDGAVELFATHELPTRLKAIYVVADPGRGRRPYFPVGWLNNVGDAIALDRHGAVWHLDHDYGPTEWTAGRGALCLAETLPAFVIKLAERRGAWWWLPGFDGPWN